MADTTRERYERLRATLWSERSTFEAHWRELSDYLLPRRTRWWAGDRNKGDRRSQYIIDSTARFSARTLQSGLHAGLTSPARPWFVLTTPDQKLAERQSVKEWLATVTRRMRTVFAGTNLYNSLPIVYGDMGVFGTAAVSVLEDSKDLFRCYAYPIGSYALGLDARGLATTFVRDYELTVRQVVEQFGVVRGYKDVDWTHISPAVKALWDRSMYETAVEVTWIVTPNEEYRPNRLDAKFKRWASCHLEKGNSQQGVFLREGGFDSFPVLAPRWDITGEDTYGTDCPGMTALGDVKQLQAMQKEKAKAVKKMVDPPMQGPPHLRTTKVSILPGDINYVDGRTNDGLRPAHEVRLDVSHLSNDIRETQYRIQRAFYEDLFLMLQTAPRAQGGASITAREIEERHEEKLLALGPVLERTNDELLSPLIDRVYAMMDQIGMIPPPPPELEDVQLKVEYISVMAQAQKMVGVVAQDRFLSSVVPLMGVFPEAKDKINIYQAVDDYAEQLGIDPRMVRETDQAEAMAQAREQQAQAMAEAQQAQMAAKATRDLGTTPTGTNSVLDQLLGGAAGSAPAAS